MGVSTTLGTMGSISPEFFTNAHLKELRLRMRQLQSKWERQLEAEARECEHAARRNTLTAAIPPGRSLARVFAKRPDAATGRADRHYREVPHQDIRAESERTPALNS